MELANIGNLQRIVESFNAFDNFDNEILDVVALFNSLDKTTQNYILTSGKLSTSQLELISNNIEWGISSTGAKVSLSGLTKEELEQAIATATLSNAQKKATLTTANWSIVLKGLATQFKTLLLTNPVAWVVGLTAAIGLLVKGYDKLINKREELARTKLTELDDEITKYDEEIKSLEALHSKLESAKGDKAELAQIQDELNDVIGETPGLINAESEAYEIANAKLKANIELKKEQLKQAQQEKVNASKELFDNNTFEADWNFDVTGEQMKTVAESYRKYLDIFKDFSKETKEALKGQGIESAEDFAFSKIKTEGIDLGNGFTRIFNFDKSDWQKYWNDQVQVAYDVFDQTISSYDGVGGQDFLRNLVSNMVRGGSSLSEISTALTKVIENKNIQKSVNEYWESLVNSDIDSEKALKNVRNIFDGIVTQFPELEAFFDEFFDQIVTGFEKASEEIGEVTITPQSFTEVLSQIQSLSTGLDQLDKIYADIKDKGEFDFSSIFNNEDFANTFNVEGVKEEYEDFLKVVSSSPTDINACQTAFNNLATAYIYSTGALDDLTEETKAQAIAMLEQMGVANALTIVENKLNEIEAKAFFAKKDLTNATIETYTALLNEAESAGIAKEAIYELALQEIAYGENTLSFSEKIKQIQGIAEAYGDVATMALAASMIDDPSFDPYKHGGGYNALESIILSAKEAIKKNTEDTVIEFKPISVGSTASTTSKAKETKQFFDYTANSIQNLQNELDSLNTELENTTGWKKQLEIQQQIIEAQKNLRQGYISQAEAYKNYYKEVSKGLTKQQKADIESGKVFKVQEYGQDTYDKLTKAQSAYQDWQDALKNVDSSLLDISETADAIYNIPLEKATEKVETFTERIEDLVKTLDTTNGLSLDEVHALYNKQRKNYTKIYMEHLSAEADAKLSLTKESKELKKAIKGESKAKQKYVKEQISNNKVIDTSKLKTKKAKEAAAEYNSALEASKTATKNVKTALKEYTYALQELAKSEIDRIINHYDNYSGLSEAKQQRFKTQIDMLEAQGYVADDDYYKKLIDISGREISRLERESDRISNLMNSGTLSEDGYFDALQSLYDIAEEIDKCKLNQIEWNKAIQQIEFDKFDKLQKRIGNIITEATFMISLLDKDKYFDDDGNMTDEGLTAQALHAQNYNTYLAQSENYGKEIKKINALLANDPANQTLIERRNELIEAQQNAILSAHSEKEAMIDLIEEGYNAQIDAMSELVDAKQKLLDKEKELHDYQKSIREQQTDITVLRKQIEALENSSDRADRAKLLKLKEQLKEAEEKLAEDQYQHSIDTQKNALDEALEEYTKRTEEYLENEEELFEETIDNINSHATDVLESIKNKAESVGYELSDSIINIWSNTTPIDSFEDAVIDSFTGIGNAIQNVINKLEQMYQKYQQIADTNMNDVIKDIEGYPDKDESTSASQINPHEIKRILGNASGKAGASNNGDSILNEYLSGLGYGMLSRDEMIELAQALGLKEITDLESLRASGGTSVIKDTLEKYLNSGYSVVDELEKTGGVSKANQQNIINLIQGANKYTGETGKLSDLNKYIYSNYNKKWLNKGQMVALAQYLGYSNITSEDDITADLKSKMLAKLKKAKFNDGGIIKRLTGEDGIVLANSGEGILTKEHVKLLQNRLPLVNDMVESMKTWEINTLPKLVNLNRNMGNVNVQVDVHGNMDNVTLDQMKYEISNAMRETLKATPDYLMGVTRKFGC